SVSHACVFERLDDPQGIQAHRDGGRLTVRDDRPRQLLVAEVLRHRNREHAPLPPWKKVRRLTLIGPARLDAVVRTDRDVENLFLVSIEVTDEQREAAVRIRIPSFERTGDALAGVLCWFERK